jgi:hypothetical protein
MEKKNSQYSAPP